MYDHHMLVVSLTTTTNTWPIHATRCFFSNSPARPITQTVWQDAQAIESANLGKTCKYGIASAAAADAIADTIATDVDDTVDVAASTAGLSILNFNKCISAL